MRRWYKIALIIWAGSGLPVMVLGILWLDFDLSAFAEAFVPPAAGIVDEPAGLYFVVEKLLIDLLMLHPILLLPFGIKWRGRPRVRP